MTTDALLAIAHHLLLVVLVGALSAEKVLMRDLILAPSSALLARIGRVDAIYGVSAALLLAAGVSRVLLGAKGAAYYMALWTFHAKIGAFVLMALLSLPPTLAWLRWRRASRADGTLPDPAAVRRLAPLLHAQGALLLAIVVFAALMARGIG